MDRERNAWIAPDCLSQPARGNGPAVTRLSAQTRVLPKMER